MYNFGIGKTEIAIVIIVVGVIGWAIIEGIIWLISNISITIH